jgi:hypothetical protein
LAQKLTQFFSFPIPQTQARKSPKHPTVLYILGRALALADAPADVQLQCWEECAARNARYGHLEAAALLVARGKREEALAHVAEAVAVEPLQAYSRFANILFRHAQKQTEMTPAERRAVTDHIKVLFDVYHQLRESLGAEPSVEHLRNFDEFFEWSQEALAAADRPHQRVDFVPVVEPTGLLDDNFEKEFL